MANAANTAGNLKKKKIQQQKKLPPVFVRERFAGLGRAGPLAAWEEVSQLGRGTRAKPSAPTPLLPTPRIPLTTDSPGLEILKNKLRRRRAIMERGLARRPTAGTAITGRKTKPRPHGSTATTATASWGPYLQEHCHMKYSHEVPHLTLATDGEGKRTVTAVVGVLCGEGSSPLVGCAQITTG